MGAFEGLVRARRRECDERRRSVAELEGLAGRWRADAARLTSEMVPANFARVGATAALDRELIERRRRLERSIAELDAWIDAAREALFAAEQQLRHGETHLTQTRRRRPAARLP